jgi:hypothetical protein
MRSPHAPHLRAARDDTGTFKPDAAMRACSPCVSGAHTSASRRACECDQGLYPVLDAHELLLYCNPCPANAVCSGDAIIPDDGYLVRGARRHARSRGR